MWGPATGRTTTGFRASARLLLAAAMVLSVAACTGDEGPDLSREDFKPGVCRESAQPVIDLRTAVQQIQDGEASQASAGTLQERQQELRATRDGADDSLRAKLTELTNAIGVLRIGIDAGTVGPAQTEDVTAALERVIAACTEA